MKSVGSIYYENFVSVINFNGNVFQHYKFVRLWLYLVFDALHSASYSAQSCNNNPNSKYFPPTTTTTTITFQPLFLCVCVFFFIVACEAGFPRNERPIQTASRWQIRYTSLSAGRNNVPTTDAATTAIRTSIMWVPFQYSNQSTFIYGKSNGFNKL